MTLDDLNVVIDIAQDSQAARGGVQMGDTIVAIDGMALTATAMSVLANIPVAADVAISLRSAAAADVGAAKASYSVSLKKTTLGTKGFGLSLDAANRVTEVSPGGMAERDGQIAIGDVLVSLNGTPVETPDEAESDALTRSNTLSRSKTFTSRTFNKARKKLALAASDTAKMRWMRRQKTLLPLYSTAVLFEEYERHCPPDLKALGIFHLNFEKWPETASLQPVAAALSLSTLPRRKHTHKRFARFGRLKGREPQVITVQAGIKGDLQTDRV